MTSRRPDAEDAVHVHLLVLRCQAGDERAFSALMTRYGDRTMHYLRGLVGEAADDVQQDVWLAVYRRVHTLADPGAFRTWLFRTARHRAIDHLRARRREQELFVETDSLDALPHATEAEDDAPDVDGLAAVIDDLAPIHREVLMLRYRDAMSYTEIALVVGCTVGTVRSRLHYARQHLHDLLAARRNPRREAGAPDPRGLQ